jgi:uncharacterized protein
MNAARACLLALLVWWPFAAAADVAVPPLTGRVVDQTGTLSSSDIAALSQTLKGLEARKGSQIAVLIVPTTAPETIEQYSIRVAEAWKIGRKKIDDGALLVVAKDDHRLRIEVGYGLEGALNDVTAKRIIDEIITPKFRSGDFSGGISAGIARMIRIIDGEPLPAPVPQQSWEGSGDVQDLFNPVLIFAVFIAGGFLRKLLGTLIGSVVAGGVVGLLAWFIVGTLALSLIAAIIAFLFNIFADSIASSSGGNSGWSSSGGGGSFSGGSSSSSGGFSGGGGSFGGGGASGSW